ncbi:MAG TPA: ABC transporter ATP-binding protein [Acidimicrobiia bacterium]|nr:ABC transporter ATP-binding protein [Acidimicrobiia bacterium]
MLAVEGLTARYGAITALRDVSLHVDEGEIVCLIGPNGAGKTTLMSSVTGLLRPAAGTVSYRGEDVTRLPPDELLRRGLALVPERRRIFADLTVEENLLVAGITVSSGDRRRRITEVMEIFPVLGEKRALPAGYLSGGQAQQLAVARALMTRPRLILMDEPSLGLAPALVKVIFQLVARLRDDGTTMLVVEQNARKALDVADRAYMLRTGRLVDEASQEDFARWSDLFESYVGG